MNTETMHSMKIKLIGLRREHDRLVGRMIAGCMSDDDKERIASLRIDVVGVSFAMADQFECELAAQVYQEAGCMRSVKEVAAMCDEAINQMKGATA